MPQSESNIIECRNAEHDLFSFVRGRGAKVALVQHLTLTELTGEYQRGYYANQAVAKEEGVPYVDDSDGLRGLLGMGVAPFYSGDTLHLNGLGQGTLAQTLQRAVDLALKSN
jgi:hypothetical protein